MPWKWCVESMYIILNLCMHTKRNPHHKMLVFKYIHQLHLHDLAFSSFHIFFWNKMSFKIKKNKNAENHILCPTNTYILYKYIHKYILHTTAINLKRGIYRAKGDVEWGGVVVVFVCVCVLACVVKWFVPVWSRQSDNADVVLCVGLSPCRRAHTSYISPSQLAQ